MNIIIDAGSAKLAGLQIDTLSKYRAGQLTLDQWERFNNLSPDDREARFGDWSNGQVAQVIQPKPKSSILELVSTVLVSATKHKFVASSSLIRGRTLGIQVNISGTDQNFKDWFLLGYGKTEDPISEQALSYYKLLVSSFDGPIITELGGEEKSETTLTEMFSLMEKQGKGEDGVLLNNGHANIFYIRDSPGVLRAVFVRWDLKDGGWGITAWSIVETGTDASMMCGVDNQVFSRNI